VIIARAVKVNFRSMLFSFEVCLTIQIDYFLIFHGKAMMSSRILISNDDGIDAPGLSALYDAVKELGEVTVIAPVVERSAVGHAISFENLQLEKRLRDGKDWGYALDGTPADCVKLGITTLMKEKPHLVISGINRGANTGNSILYSGTVAAAMEGTMYGVPSMAVSLAARRQGHDHVEYATAARFAGRLAQCVLKKGLPAGVLLNVNVPHVPDDQIQGVVISRQGQSMYVDVFQSLGERAGIAAFKNIGDEMIPSPGGEDADDVVLQQNKISITPLHYDLTLHHFREELERWVRESICPDFTKALREISEDLHAEFRG
jgi:5'-nucleotidase